ncbi:ribonuclease H1 isoform X2 [Diachasma alloeum]|uniref:ribonuclease H1 isoform X2 n=1 Tax=Diachasma alloeum TaxID=454923 RepID=UPI0007383EB5|nr:ribonuclease H1 isoform X2 [Diachasma alloeum]
MRRFIFGFNYHSPIKLLKMPYYAVAKGRNPGIYMSWDECKAQVDRFPGAAFKKFNSQAEAQTFIGGGSSGAGGKERTEKASARYQPYSTTPRDNKMKRTEKKKREGSPDMEEFLRFEKGRKGFEEGRKYPIAFTTDSEGRVDIFTDGACSGNGYDGAKAGFGVYFGDDHPLNVAKPVVGRATNNNAEIQAVTEAALISKKHGISKIRINTDSQFLISCLTQWMPGWKRRGWKTSSNQPVINKEELMAMEKALAGLDYEFYFLNTESRERTFWYPGE